MDFKDWRKARDKPNTDPEPPRVNKFHGRRYRDYIEEQIAQARERGEFDNLRGFGKPLRLDDDDFYAGDKALAYGLLKSHGFAPAEIELAKEIRTGSERAEAKLERVRQRGRVTRTPFPAICQREASLQCLGGENRCRIRADHARAEPQDPDAQFDYAGGYAPPPV